MIVRKLRLKHGWTQSQLAEMTGLTTRTIQRIEQGHRPSIESCKALASVFEVDLSVLQPEETNMNNDTELKLDEQLSLNYAKRIKEFYEGLIAYVVLAVVFFSIKGLDEPVLYYVFGGVGIAMIIQGLIAFEVISFMNPKWERKVAEKKLGRKL